VQYLLFGYLGWDVAAVICWKQGIAPSSLNFSHISVHLPFILSLNHSCKSRET
jgi:hypothetical protein